MALKPINTVHQPYGQFDGQDSILTSLKGGEVVGFTYISSTTEKKANDVLDGYVSNTKKQYPAVTNALVSGMRPLFLAHEGTNGYGQILGKLVGSYLGQDSVGVDLGYHSTAGSGKVALYDGPGLYTVTLDAVDLDESTGLQPTNTTISGNAALYATDAGLLTPNVAEAFESVVVGRFIEFTTNRAMVTTPLSMVSAPNSPQGATGKKPVFDRVLLRFKVED